MVGFIYAITAALLFAIREGFNKKATQKINVYTIFWATTVIALPFFFIGLIIEGFPVINDLFWLALGANSALFLTTSLLLIRAVQVSPLSLTLPLLSFSPLFMLLTSWIMLGEFPNAGGVVGIVLIPFGAFMLNVKKISKGILAPIKALKSETGSKYALLIAVIWSITSNSDKIAIQNASTFFYLFSINLILAIVLTIIIITKYHGKFIKEAHKSLPLLVSIGVSYSIATSLQMLAIQKTLVPYVISIKRAGLVLGGIIIGTLVFKEKDFRYRIIGGIIMTIGVVLIILFS